MNGKSLLMITIRFNVDCIGNYRIARNNEYQTRVIIEKTTELIVSSKEFLLATHPESRVSLYNLN